MQKSDDLPCYRIRDNIGVILLVAVVMIICILLIIGFIWGVAALFAILGI